MSRRLLLIAGLIALVALLVIWRMGASSESEEVEGSSASASETNPEEGGEGSATSPILPPTRLGSAGTGAADVAVAQVSGTVTDLESGEPVPWVDVIFKTRDGEAAVTSDESGRYTTSLAAGQYTLRAIGEGVIAKRTPVLRIGGVANVTRDIVVARLATLRGHVVGPDGAGIENVEVLLRNDTRNAKAFPSEGEVGAGVSASDGSFELFVPPGSVDLAASLDTTTVFASVEDVPSGGEKSGVKIVFDRRGRISGRVLLPEGAPVGDADVLLSYRREGTSRFDSREARTDSSGAFSFRELVPTVHVVEALLPGHAPSAPETIKLTANSFEADVELTLNKPASLSGKVVDAEGRPVGNVQVAQVWRGSKQRFEKIETYSSGEFSFGMVGPGPHILRARKEGYADATLRDVMAPKSDIVLKLVASGGIEGTVVDDEGNPVTRFSVSVVGKGKSSKATSEHRSRDGSFQIYPLSPGIYAVVISAKGIGKHATKVTVPSGSYVDASTTLVVKKSSPTR